MTSTDLTLVVGINAYLSHTEVISDAYEGLAFEVLAQQHEKKHERSFARMLFIRSITIDGVTRPHVYLDQLR